MSLGLVPLTLFLLVATRQDVCALAITVRTLAVWGSVALLGGLLGAWPLYPLWAAAVYLVLSIAGVGRGDRYGGVLVGVLLGVWAIDAVMLALVLVVWYSIRRDRSPHALPFYPFLSVSVAVMIGVQWAEAYLRA